MPFDASSCTLWLLYCYVKQTWQKCSCRLDEVVDAHALITTLLQAMPKCKTSVQQGILELLPELVLEDHCQVQLLRML